MKKYLFLFTCLFALNCNADSTWIEYESTSREIVRLHRELGVGSIIKSIEENYTTRVKEQVTEKHRESSQEGIKGRLNLLFLKVAGSASEESSSSYDMTKFLVQNPAETASFPRRQKSKEDQLRKELTAWMEHNETRIIYFKQLGIAHMAAAYDLVRRGERISEMNLQAIANMLFDVHFLGELNVTRCIKTKYADRESESNSSESASLSARFFGVFSGSAGYDSSESSYWRQISHTETECHATTNTIKVDPQSSLFMVSYTVLDQKLANWIRAVHQALLVQAEESLFPTFGSPYYE